MPSRIITILAVLAITLAVWRIEAATTEIVVNHGHIGTIPFTVFKSQDARPAPVVVLCHGFAGSQQMMQPFAVTLARNGYTAITFDFPGHGRNAQPLPGGLSDPETSSRALLAALDEMVRFAQAQPGGDRVALIGHSMGSDVVVRYAAAHPGIVATVAVSLFSADETTASPRNLLIVDGAWETAVMQAQGFRVVSRASGGPAAERVTYGSFADGTARRIVLAAGVEHIAVLYARDSLAESLAWLDAATGRMGSGFIDRRGPWLGLLFAGVVALAWPLSRLLPRVATIAPSAPPWTRLFAIAALPALLTPLILWKLPTDFLSLSMAGHLTVHFGLYGILTFAARRLLARQQRHAGAGPVGPRGFAFATLAASAFCIGAIALPADLFVASFRPTAERVSQIAVLFCGLLPFFAADEYLIRGEPQRHGAAAVTKVLLLASLLLAVALAPQRLFFLLIILPAMVLYLLVYGLFAAWIYRATRHPMVGAIGVSLAIAWGIGSTFPMLAAR